MSQERGRRFLAELPGLGQDLPFDLGLLRQLFAQTRDDALASLNDISKTLSQDPGLAARVLAIANSAYYGLQAEVASVERAVAVLGLAEIRILVLALGVRALSAKLRDGALLDLRAFWRHGVLAAAAARILAGPLDLDPDDLFTAALLHDLGKLITALHRPQDWRACTERARTEGIPLFRAEQRHWGLEHGLIGSLTLSAWLLPARLCEPVGWHHSPGQAPDYVLEAKALCLADALAHGLDQGPKPAPGPWQDLADQISAEFPPQFPLDAGEAAARLAEAARDQGLVQLMGHLAP